MDTPLGGGIKKSGSEWNHIPDKKRTLFAVWQSKYNHKNQLVFIFLCLKLQKMSKKQSKLIHVEGNVEDYEKPRQNWNYSIEHFTPLGRELKISPKALLRVNAPGYRKEIFVESVNLMIGIGKDHTADLIMCKDSWEAFVKGEPITFTMKNELIQKHGFPPDKIKK